MFAAMAKRGSGGRALCLACERGVFNEGGLCVCVRCGAASFALSQVWAAAAAAGGLLYIYSLIRFSGVGGEGGVGGCGCLCEASVQARTDAHTHTHPNWETQNC